MTHKTLIRKLQISCLGLDAVDPLRLLVDDVIEALREHAMREVQRLGQEIEQEPDVQETLHWHAFNYRQAHIDQAHEMWEKLEQFVDYKIKASQRTWVGLTDEEENEYNYLGPDMHWVIQEIEAKLKEKNT